MSRVKVFFGSGWWTKEVNDKQWRSTGRMTQKKKKRKRVKRKSLLIGTRRNRKAFSLWKQEIVEATVTNVLVIVSVTWRGCCGNASRLNSSNNRSGNSSEKKTVSAIIYHCLLMATTDQLVIVDITAFLTEAFVVTLRCRFSVYPYKEQNSLKID